MSRDIRRVPLDFDAPHETWWGYVRPKELRLPDCPACDGRGYTPAAQWLDAIAFLITMLGDDALYARAGKEIHPWLDNLGNAPGRGFFPMRVSDDIHELLRGLADRDGPDFMGWGGNSWAVFAKLREAAGLGEKWGYCPTCDGEGKNPTPEQQAAHDAWTKTDPPTGEGWQMWQTVSEGGPASPVFPTAGALAEWLTTEEAGRDQMPDFPSAMRFVEAGWAPSGGTFRGEMLTGTVLVGKVTDPAPDDQCE